MGGAPEVPGIDLGQEIGRGGGGRVHLGRHRTLDRAVAVKVIDTGDDPEVVERFLAECRTAASLSGVEGVVPIHDAGTTATSAYIVMPYLGGGTLRDRLRSGPIPTEQIADVVERIGNGLSAAHAAGLVHRDVKPENILIGDDGRPALADFGVAALWQATAGLTAAKDFSGTVAYTAPERLAGLSASPKVDQFALALVAWEAITGSHPFMTPGAEMPQVIARILDPTPPDASALPEGVAAVLLVALDHDPARRYDTMSDFVSAFADALGVSPAPFDVVSAEIPLTVIPAGVTRRHRRWWVAAAVALVLGGAVAASALGGDGPAQETAEAAGTAGETAPATVEQTVLDSPRSASSTVLAAEGASDTTTAEFDGASSTAVDGATNTPAEPPAGGGLPAAPSSPPQGGAGSTGGETPSPTAPQVTTTTAPVTTTTTGVVVTTTTVAATTTTTKAPTTTTTLPAVPGAPSGFVVSSPAVVSGACTTSPCDVQVALSWSAASGTVDGYTVRATRYWFGSDCGGAATPLDDPVTWTTTNRSLTVTTKNANAPCGWVRWEVWASNAGGFGPVAIGSGVIPNVVGSAAGPGAARIQTVGAYVGWEASDPACGAANTICTQSVGAGSTVANGTVVWLKQTG